MTRSIKKGIQKKGFALIEAVSQCPIQYGRASKLGGAVDMLKHFKESSIRLTKARDMDEAQLQGKIIVGEFSDREKAELSEQWVRLRCEMTEDN
jgi:2-oxoglutarate ferredoxin oxidoreductase subunit beta